VYCSDCTMIVPREEGRAGREVDNTLAEEELSSRIGDMQQYDCCLYSSYRVLV
jgi:hypothetical protein